MNERFIIDARYSGPHELTADVSKALQVLSENLSLENSVCQTHSVLRTENLEENNCVEATAIYLVSAISQSIEANLEIRAALFDEENLTRDLHKDVVTVIGDASIDPYFKTMQRDPWLWEGISHMLIHLSRENKEFHPTGAVLAKTSIKYDVNDHGLDVITIYEASGLGIAAGECKAYLSNPTQAIVDATQKLSEVDSNKRDIEIRAAVNQMRSALNAETQKQLAGSFWKDERTYLPFVCCDEAHALNWNRNRKSLRQLAVPVLRKILIPVVLPNVRTTFDRICDYMRAYATLRTVNDV